MTIYFSVIFVETSFNQKSTDLSFLKGHRQLWVRTDLNTTFASLTSIYFNPKSNLRVGYIQKSTSILPGVSFDPQSFTENLSLSKLLLIPLHYFIIFGEKQCSKEHKQNSRETLRPCAGEIAVVYQSNLRNESVRLASKIIVIYFIQIIWKIDGKGYIYLEKQAVST